MGRKKGSKNTKKRSSRRSAYDTYSYWYDKYTKGHKKGWFGPKYSRDEFFRQYEKAKRAGFKVNIARTIARSQEYVDRSFEKKYKDLYGKELPDISDIAVREDLFWDFVNDMMANNGLTLEEARDEFEGYFY